MQPPCGPAKMIAMTPQTWITAAAVLVALGSLFFTARASTASVHQTKIQRQVREDAAQPYVWADLRPFEEHGQFIVLVVGNSGPTVATDVRVTITPDLVSSPAERAKVPQRVLSNGISALPPGRTISWNLGVPWQILKGDQGSPHHFQIDATGPFGPLPTLSYTVDLGDLYESFAVPPGTLNGVAVAIDKLREQIAEHS